MNRIDQFLDAASFAVAGASTDRSKYGNKVLLALRRWSDTVYPLNPTADHVEGVPAYASLADLPEVPEALSIITPPQVTRKVVEDAIALGVRQIWMQPGAEDAQASQAARTAGLNVIDDGSCILVALAAKR
ncbi:MAG: CoA-binding protein [Pirellulaceae bacterium]|nr:CoA-binding protein [Pirellulaceae bacterium]